MLQIPFGSTITTPKTFEYVVYGRITDIHGQLATQMFAEQIRRPAGKRITYVLWIPFYCSQQWCLKIYIRFGWPTGALTWPQDRKAVCVDFV